MKKTTNCNIPEDLNLHQHRRDNLISGYYLQTLRAGWSGDRIPLGTRFSSFVQSSPRAHPASYTVPTGSFPGVNGRGVALTTHHI
jgi:hypothetical protein